MITTEEAKGLVGEPVKISPRSDIVGHSHQEATLIEVNNGMALVRIKGRNGKQTTQAVELKYVVRCKSLESKKHQREGNDEEIAVDLCIAALYDNSWKVFTIDKKFSYDLSKAKVYDKANAGRAIGKVKKRKGLPCDQEKVKVMELAQVTKWIEKFLRDNPNASKPRQKGEEQSQSEAEPEEQAQEQAEPEEQAQAEEQGQAESTGIDKDEVFDEFERLAIKRRELRARISDLKATVEKIHKEIEETETEASKVESDISSLKEFL